MSERAPLVVRRGDVVWLCCDPSLGVEPKKTRTCVVVSNDIANRYGQAVTVVPTQRYSKERAGRAYNVDLRAPRSTMKEQRIANASMIMTYDKERIVSRAGVIHGEAQGALDRAIALHLQLSIVE